MDASKGHILFVYPHADPLDPAGSGGQNRLYNFIDQISRQYDVTVVGPAGETETTGPIETRTYRRRAPGFLSDLDYGLAMKLYETIQSIRPDIIHIPYPSGIISSKVLLTVAGTDARIVLDAHDVMSERAREFNNENLGTVSRYLRQIYVPSLESVATSVADHILTVSEKDARLMQRLNRTPQRKLSVIPNGAELLDYSRLSDWKTTREELGIETDTTAIVFHGNYETGTHNREAANRIINQIAPRFRDQEQTRFFIIGKGAPDSRIENVTSLGFVEDLYSTLNAMDIAAVPLISGTATKLKMFDYMSVGLPIISTKKGTEGIDIEDGTEVILSGVGTDEFTVHIRRLLNDKELRDRLGRNGQQLIEDRYNWEAIGDRLDETYQSVITT